ncbi:hypothetical protein B0J13DRAFT_534711 [Dactylonectria estremocensis]|uniref:Uncharacterized protein n=1 Tax=Dactylonectria estremocensis TaxID=1079267 RepID=A0A9P9CZL7_9HYPO|nr:hypothetical protein B0J13DRAFT_534711 [Dactylonectria estremocensis]
MPPTSPSTTPSDLDAPTRFDPSDTNREVTVDTSSSVDYTGYEGIDWNRLSGYCIRKHRRRQRTGWVWEYGFDIEKDALVADSGSVKSVTGRRHPSLICTMLHLRAKQTVIWKMSYFPWGIKAEDIGLPCMVT